MRWSQILAQNRDFCLPHLHSTPPPPVREVPVGILPFGTEKLEWLGYPTVKKFWRYVYCFWQNVRTWQTHTHTAWQHRPRLHSITRQKLKLSNVRKRRQQLTVDEHLRCRRNSVGLHVHEQRAALSQLSVIENDTIFFSSPPTHINSSSSTCTMYNILIRSKYVCANCS